MATYDEHKALAQMTKVAETVVDLELKAGEMLVLISAIQLASRHPSFTGEARTVAERVARNWQDIVAGRGSDMWLALEAGWDPGQDVNAELRMGSAESPHSALPTPHRTLEVGRGKANVIRGLSKALMATLNRWIRDHGPVDYIDVFMAAHNYHCYVVLDLEKQTKDREGFMRKMALDTFRARMERKQFDSANESVEV